MKRQQTKSLKNKIFDDKSGSSYLFNSLNYNNRRRSSRTMKGLKTKHSLFKRVFKNSTKKRQFKVLTRF